MKVKHWADFKYIQGKLDSISGRINDKELGEISKSLEKLFLEICSVNEPVEIKPEIKDVTINLGPVSRITPDKLKKKGTQEEKIEQETDKLMDKHLNDTVPKV